MIRLEKQRCKYYETEIVCQHSGQRMRNAYKIRLNYVSTNKLFFRGHARDT